MLYYLLRRIHLSYSKKNCQILREVASNPSYGKAVYSKKGSGANFSALKAMRVHMKKWHTLQKWLVVSFQIRIRTYTARICSPCHFCLAQVALPVRWVFQPPTSSHASGRSAQARANFSLVAYLNGNHPENPLWGLFFPW